ncbi:SusD/RagB family nutrient-binding outer membrane lipoprotein [Alistipes sp.]|uniref:SusD/RagB family nutrient-binding outer membrane lipoprotein n=1 Tax=Alistipes sp. TaxID=1872444 RepID=UPI0025BADBD3|nr:SusD/RagB family nutrient-binding outer membrane lipoprotein [Alistipes sp.]
MQIHKILFSVVGLLLCASCSNDYMEDLNTDPSKAAAIDPNAQLTTAQLQTYGDLDLTETFRSYIYAFTQHTMGCWNTTNYGGRHMISDADMSKVWAQYYQMAIKNLVDAENASAGNEDQVNIHAAIRIYKVYMMSLLTDLYGDIPYFEAGLGFIGGIPTPRYDTQEAIYNDFFKTLTEAAASVGSGRDVVSGDLIFGGDCARWKKFANSLRLRFAMRLSKVLPEKARAEFEAALQDEGGIMTSSADDALVKHMNVAFNFGSESYGDYRGNKLAQRFFGNDPVNNPTFICSTLFDALYDTKDPRTFMIARFYYDGMMSLTSPDGRIDLTDEMIKANWDVKADARKPGAYAWEPWPRLYESPLAEPYSQIDPTFTNNMSYASEPKVATNFLLSDNPGVVMTSAEVKFLLAEAKLNGWAVGAEANTLFEEGVTAAINFLTDNYDCRSVAADEIRTYLDGLHFANVDTDIKRRLINTQAWILHFTNPCECWANQRRSGYPQLKSPAEYGFSNVLVDSQEIPVRLCYPRLESSYNSDNYNEALARMGGSNSWNTPVWWDVD